MTIDSNKVIPHSANFFRAFGGTGVRVRLADDKGSPMSRDGQPQWFLFGAYTEMVARQLVRDINAHRGGDFLSSVLEAAARSAARKPGVGAA